MLDVIGGLKSDSLLARVPADRQRALGRLGGQLFRNRDKDGIAPRPRRALRRGHRLRRAAARRQGARRPRGRHRQHPRRLRRRPGRGHGEAMGPAAVRVPGRAGRARAQHHLRAHERHPRRGRGPDPLVGPVHRVVPARLPLPRNPAAAAHAHPRDAAPRRQRRPRHRLRAAEHGRRRPVPGAQPGGRGGPADRVGGRDRDGDARRRAGGRAGRGSSAAWSRASAPTSWCGGATPPSWRRASTPRTSSSPSGTGRPPTPCWSTAGWSCAAGAPRWSARTRSSPRRAPRSERMAKRLGLEPPGRWPRIG